MLRTHYKPRTHHRDGYHASATLATLTQNNGRDLYDPTSALLVASTPAASRKIADRYVLMADPTTRAAMRRFQARKRAARKTVRLDG